MYITTEVGRVVYEYTEVADNTDTGNGIAHEIELIGCFSVSNPHNSIFLCDILSCHVQDQSANLSIGSAAVWHQNWAGSYTYTISDQQHTNTVLINELACYFFVNPKCQVRLEWNAIKRKCNSKAAIEPSD